MSVCVPDISTGTSTQTIRSNPFAPRWSRVIQSFSLSCTTAEVFCADWLTDVIPLFEPDGRFHIFYVPLNVTIWMIHRIDGGSSVWTIEQRGEMIVYKVDTRVNALLPCCFVKNGDILSCSRLFSNPLSLFLLLSSLLLSSFLLSFLLFSFSLPSFLFIIPSFSPSSTLSSSRTFFRFSLALPCLLFPLNLIYFLRIVFCSYLLAIISSPWNYLVISFFSLFSRSSLFLLFFLNLTNSYSFFLYKSSSHLSFGRLASQLLPLWRSFLVHSPPFCLLVTLRLWLLSTAALFIVTLLGPDLLNRKRTHPISTRNSSLSSLSSLPLSRLAPPLLTSLSPVSQRTRLPFFISSFFLFSFSSRKTDTTSPPSPWPPILARPSPIYFHLLSLCLSPFFLVYIYSLDQSL